MGIEELRYQQGLWSALSWHYIMFLQVGLEGDNFKVICLGDFIGLSKAEQIYFFFAKFKSAILKASLFPLSSLCPVVTNGYRTVVIVLEVFLVVVNCVDGYVALKESEWIH